jgi:hypothetical protein
MPALFDLLPREQQLRLAVRTKGPARVAQTLAMCVGQCYDRAPFDAVAREVYSLYAVESDDSAGRFRRRLDRRLRERARPPVRWEGHGA